MADPQPTQNQMKQGDKGGLSLFQKVLLVILAVGFVALLWIFIFGGIQNVYSVVIIIAFGFGLCAIGYIVIKAIGIITAKKYYSPKEDFYTRISNIAIESKPDNLNDLYTVGSKMKKGYRIGKIIGVLELPHLVGKVKKDKDGKPVTVYSEKLKKTIPQYEKIELGESGDTFFIAEKGFLFPKRHNIRCDKKLHSDLNGDVYIFDVNPVPYGSFFQYPFKQMQRDAPRIMLQNQLEVIMMTHEYQYDLISQGADMGIYMNPAMRMIRDSKQEIEGQPT